MYTCIYIYIGIVLSIPLLWKMRKALLEECSVTEEWREDFPEKYYLGIGWFIMVCFVVVFFVTLFWPVVLLITLIAIYKGDL